MKRWAIVLGLTGVPGVAAVVVAVSAGARADAPASGPATSRTRPAPPPERLIARQHEAAVRASLPGQWRADLGKAEVRLTLSEGAKFTLGDVTGRYAVEAGALRLHGPKGEVTYQFELAGDQLTLTGGDLAQPLKLTRAATTRGLGSWLWEWSARSAASKLYRVLFIAAVAAACRLLLFLLRAGSRFVIYSEWGPLKLVYRYRKNRTMTIHALTLNLAKYVVYLTALGFILTELGVNYAAYLASLSVVGLAIAFGSQGLVQDMVTGFFIIFEGQFDVGDMVEIPPNTGIVEEIGLRMTKLRNYLGQQFIIPNRNIAAVGNYVRGAQEAWVDVAVPDPDAAAKAADVLAGFVDEVARQFEQVILSAGVAGPLSLATHEHFVRLRFSFWPQQQWVIEQQVVPRAREVLAAAGCEVPGDRVAVFYRAREQAAAPGRGRRKGRQKGTA